MDYEQNLRIEDEAFSLMRMDANAVLKRLIKNMIEKESFDGKLTINLELHIDQEFIENTNTEVDGQTRRVLKPKLTHKIGSMMQIKEEAKGDRAYDNYELVFSDEINEYIIRPIKGDKQMSIFDMDIMQDEDVIDASVIEGKEVIALPAPDDDVTTDMFETEDDDYGYELPEDF